MRLLLLQKLDQPCAKQISKDETGANMLATCADELPIRVAICQDCRHRISDLTEADYFRDLSGYLRRSNTNVIARRVSLFQPIEHSLESLKTCDVFYMCGGDYYENGYE